MKLFRPTDARDKFSRRMQALAALGFALVLLSGAAAVYMATRLGQAADLVSFTFQIRALARQLMSAVQDAETSLAHWS
jgi:CHASE3 domain sensor protein